MDKKFFILFSLFFSILFIQSANAEWWNNSWYKCRNITLYRNDENTARTWEEVEFNFTDVSCSAADCNDVRIINQPCWNGGSEVWSSVLSNTSTSVFVSFIANRSTSSNSTYSIYYDNPSASAPNYDTGLVGSLENAFWIANGFLNVSNAGKSGIWNYSTDYSGTGTNYLNRQFYSNIYIYGFGSNGTSNNEGDANTTCTSDKNTSTIKQVSCWSIPPLNQPETRFTVWVTPKQELWRVNSTSNVTNLYMEHFRLFEWNIMNITTLIPPNHYHWYYNGTDEGYTNQDMNPLVVTNTTVNTSVIWNLSSDDVFGVVGLDTNCSVFLGNAYKERIWTNRAEYDGYHSQDGWCAYDYYDTVSALTGHTYRFVTAYNGTSSIQKAKDYEKYFLFPLQLSVEEELTCANWVLNSSEKGCYNTTHYRINNTYYDINGCKGYYSDYTYEPYVCGNHLCECSEDAGTCFKDCGGTSKVPIILVSIGLAIMAVIMAFSAITLSWSRETDAKAFVKIFIIVMIIVTIIILISTLWL